jgi:hypothetical protein
MSFEKPVSDILLCYAGIVIKSNFQVLTSHKELEIVNCTNFLKTSLAGQIVFLCFGPQSGIWCIFGPVSGICFFSGLTTKILKLNREN